MTQPRVTCYLERGQTVLSTFKRLKAKKDDGGLTLIELLIVIVILGILSATIVFAVGGMTSKSANAACQTDYATVTTAVDAFQAQNPGVALTTAALTGTADGGPYISAMPSNGTHYTFVITGTGTAATLGIEINGASTATAITAGESAATACTGVK